ncbi:MAG: HAMP domain-containing histidine kinase [Spirulinaceae cyanobacterium RM2_2_10]|nr:HAMP domain-containing histidine kinase [Spirulinaceae cyanobacterium RM2_2_10]
MLLTLWRVQVWEHHHLQRAKADADAAAAELAAALRELRRTQAQLVQSEKMSSLGQLVAGIAHEFNNPVTFIHTNLVHAQAYFDELVSLVQLYQEHLEPPPAAIAEQLEAMEWEFIQADLPQLLGSIRTGSERIRQLVLNLRTFARLDEEGDKSVDLHDNLDSVLMMLSERGQAQSYRRAITIERQYGSLPQIQCFPGTLNQVLLHLLTNAIDAIDTAARQSSEAAAATAPTLTIRTKALGSQRVQIGIADNGVGIPAEIRRCLFDPFFTTKPIGKGTGLGLALSYQVIVTQHGGRLSFKSQPGRGTEFVIVLPQRALTRSQSRSHLTPLSS